jgi:hypothetical protein
VFRHNHQNPLKGNGLMEKTTDILTLGRNVVVVGSSNAWAHGNIPGRGFQG